jgi:hypothetical protein
VLTAGDEDVCQQCQDIADEGPYDINEAEALIPAHPWCRCAFVPTSDRRYARDFDPDEARDPHGRWTAAAEEAQASVEKAAKADKTVPLNGSKATHPMTISTRYVTSKDEDAGDSDKDFLQAGLPAMKLDKQKFTHDVGVLRDGGYYPQLQTSETKGKSANEVAETFIQRLTDNLVFLYKSTPEKWQAAAKTWYDGARNIVTRQAAKYGLNDAAVAGCYAALSPQKDWEQNVYLGDRIIDISQTQGDHAWDDEMDKTAKEIWTSPTNLAVLKLIAGKKLNEITSPDQRAAWIRTYDEAHSDRSYRRVHPDGKFGEIARNKATKKGQLGAPTKAAWPSIPIMTNAVRALESKGDRTIISDVMGEQHKVRNFYNNILDPHSKNGDVTIDTHAVGAALLSAPAGGDVPVMHSLSTTPSLANKPPRWEAVGTSVLGVSGIYGLYAEAYRRAATQLKIEPRQLQSVTWEVKRKLFPGKLSQERIDKIAGLWKSFHEGKATLGKTQMAIVEAAGGFPKAPDYVDDDR